MDFYQVRGTTGGFTEIVLADKMRTLILRRNYSVNFSSQSECIKKKKKKNNNNTKTFRNYLSELRF